MKKLLYLLLITTFQLLAQNAPIVKLKDSTQLRLKKLNIDIKITGNYASVTYDMFFFNELERTLEGELAFPLGEGQSVSKFSMDVNGKLRDAVIVEKELARVAYETTIRQKIDPGLLEKTQGNNYKARVYPILPKKEKHIVITYEQELYNIKDHLFFELPLGIEKSIEIFSINIDVLGISENPKIIKNHYSNFFFTKNKKDIYSASIKEKNHTPNKPIKIELFSSDKENKAVCYDDFFYFHTSLKPNVRLKNKPKTLLILWDSSFSLKYRKTKEELKLLKNYIEYLNTVEVQFVAFSNQINKSISLTLNKNNWNELEDVIANINYDGGTSFEIFNSIKLNKLDEVLLFTDGLSNLGDFNSNTKTPIYVINSRVSANHEAINRITEKTGGNYINLNRLNYIDGLDLLKKETYQFLGVKHDKSINEVYPFERSNLTTNFSIAGKFKENSNIELLFGYQNKTTDVIKVNINKTQDDQLVKRLWAKQKLKDLNINKEDNKSEIVNISKKHHLITDYTSMLILDRIDDYVRYRIEPPKELKEEYKQRLTVIKDQELDDQEDLLERKEELNDDYKKIVEWYNKDFSLKKKEKKKEPKKVAAANTEPNILNTDQIVISNNTETNGLTISGNVTDKNGVLLPNVTVAISGTNINTVTNSLGFYTINAFRGQILEFTYGTNKQQVSVANSNIINASISENTNNSIETPSSNANPGINPDIDQELPFVSGVVMMETLNQPASGVSVIIKGTDKGTVTDFDGNYSINVTEGDILEFVYLGFKTEVIPVTEIKEIDVSLKDDTESLDEVVVVGYGAVKKQGVTSSISTEAAQKLMGRVAGVRVSNADNQNNQQITIRGASTNTSISEPLYVVNGVVVSSMDGINQEEIESMEVLKDASSAAIYGSRGANGVIIINTKEGLENNKEAIENLNEQISEKIELKPWNPETPYIKILEKEASTELAYKKYLEIRDDYSNSPSFYLDISDFFDNKKKPEIALRILTNLTEVELDNHELMKALAYKLEYFDQHKLAVYIYKKILELRPEDPQSYRDLALAYEETGEIQKSFDLLYMFYNGKLLNKDLDELYYGIEHVVYIELCRLVNKYKKQLKINKEQLSLFKEMPLDVRVVIDWNHNDTDIDLWVTGPKNEKTFYSNHESKIGGRLSEDLTDGYGPEEYTLKTAPKGNYSIEIDYYADNVQKISGPTMLKATLFTNYAKKNEEKKIVVLRLGNKDDEIEVAKLLFK